MLRWISIVGGLLIMMGHHPRFGGMGQALVWVAKVNAFSAPGMRASKRCNQDCLTGTNGGFARIILSLLFQNDDGQKCEEEAKHAQAPQSSRISTGSACSRFEPAGRGPLHAVISELLLW